MPIGFWGRKALVPTADWTISTGANTRNARLDNVVGVDARPRFWHNRVSKWCKGWNPNR